MKPENTGKKYDRIAQFWQNEHDQSEYGLSQLEKAIELLGREGKALDVGCGCGGRFVRSLVSRNFQYKGLDISEKMIELAREKHRDMKFEVADITRQDLHGEFDLILAWDSIFHLPLEEHIPVINKLCESLKESGVLLYTFGDEVGEHTDTWHEDQFYYSSIGINENIKTLIKAGMKPIHLELDQLPFNHVTVIARKLQALK